jgi:hypothetical protein
MQSPARYPVASPPHSFTAPASLPPVRSALRRMAITLGATVGAVLLLAGGIWLHARITPQHRVLIDNGQDFAVTVKLGDEKISLPPHQSRTVRVHDGALEVEATGPNGFHDRATLSLPDTGWKAGGRTAVYNIGGKSALALVNVTYGTLPGAEPEPMIMLPAEPHLALLPATLSGALDEAFAEQVKTNKWGVWIQHLCHVDTAAEKVGCAGAFE